MKQFKRLTIASLIALCVALVLPHALFAAPTDEPKIEEASAAIIVDGNGYELWSLNASEPQMPASTTKVITAMVVLDSGIDLNQTWEIVDPELPWYSSTAGLSDGDVLTIYELLQAMLVQSANEAASNLAICVAGSQEAFAELMNQKAREIGMINSHFMNPHGLNEEGHYSCARDLVIMGRYALENYPIIASIVRTKEITLPVQDELLDFTNTNYLLFSEEGMLGIKTGTEEAGSTLLSARRINGSTYYCCILNAETNTGRYRESVELYEWAERTATRRNTSFDELVVNSYSFMDNLAYDCVVSAISDSSFAQRIGSVDYNNVRVEPRSLAVPQEMLGVLQIGQENANSLFLFYCSRDLPAKLPAINPFALPLFVDTNTAGNSAESTADKSPSAASESAAESAADTDESVVAADESVDESVANTDESVAA